MPRTRANNASLTTAVRPLDPVAARSAAVDILDIVDAERDLTTFGHVLDATSCPA